MPKRKRRFEVLIEAKLIVFAFDAESARRKAERALSKGRHIDADVSASGEVWSYDAIPSAGPTRREAIAGRRAPRLRTLDSSA